MLLNQTACPFNIVNAFSNLEKNLRGNPSSVILLNEEIDSQLMQSIARDLHQPATTFLWTTNHGSSLEVRWFAPDAEIQLCGHGALAAIAFLLDHGNIKNKKEEITLHALHHQIKGWKSSEKECTIQLEAIKSEKINGVPELLEEALGQKIVEYRFSSNKNIVVLENEQAVANMRPDFELLRNIDVFGYAITSASDENENLDNAIDFVSRTLVPHVQQLEDHATGSSHALLVPYWAKKLNKEQLIAKQLSPRGGFFKTEYQNNYVFLTGQSYNTVEGTFLL